MDEFFSKLDEHRSRLGMSQADFAAYLGVDPTVWSRARRGRIGASPTVMAAVVARYPEMGYFLAAALQKRHTNQQVTARAGTAG